MQEDYINITLADDDEDDRLFFTDAFDEIKITTRVKTFNDGVYLMDYLNSEDATLPNVLFLDLNMPRKSGLECLKEIITLSKCDYMLKADVSSISITAIILSEKIKKIYKL